MSASSLHRALLSTGWVLGLSVLASTAVHAGDNENRELEILQRALSGMHLIHVDGKEGEATLPDLYMSRSEITQRLWREVFGDNPSEFPGCGDSCPIEMVSWVEAARFCNRLSALENLEAAYTIDENTVVWNREANGYRLPTAMEWNWAARAGGNAEFSGSSDPEEVAWYVGNAEGNTHAVEGLTPNSLGLYDMSGNVAEWVWPDSQKGTIEELGLHCGGSWYDVARRLKVSACVSVKHTTRSEKVGFRVVRPRQ